MKVSCPQCQSPKVSRWTGRNVLLTILEMVFYALLVVSRASTIAELCGVEGLQLKRTCRCCGHKFRVSIVPARRYDQCLKCDYNLTGNTSGVCPECGWKLPRWWQERIEKRTG